MSTKHLWACHSGRGAGDVPVAAELVGGRGGTGGGRGAAAAGLAAAGAGALGAPAAAARRPARAARAQAGALHPDLRHARARHDVSALSALISLYASFHPKGYLRHFIHSSIIIISLLMSPLLGHIPFRSPYGLHIRRTGHNRPRGPCAGWWVLTIANAAGANGLTCFPKQGGARDNKFLVTNRTPKSTGFWAIELLNDIPAKCSINQNDSVVRNNENLKRSKPISG
jgi:hypothetical protein